MRNNWIGCYSLCSFCSTETLELLIIVKLLIYTLIGLCWGLYLVPKRVGQETYNDMVIFNKP